MSRATPSLPFVERNLKKWVAALRSGKYTQTTGQLSRRGSFCCLGVACEVFGATFTERGDRASYKDGDTEYADDYMPPLLADELGLSEDDQKRFVRMNDSEKYSFSAIADFIEGK